MSIQQSRKMANWLGFQRNYRTISPKPIIIVARILQRNEGEEL